MSYDILPIQRIQRHRTGRQIEWRVSQRTADRFDELLRELLELEGVEEPDILQRRWALQEDIRALPNYPKRYDIDRDVIRPVVTSEVTR